MNEQHFNEAAEIKRHIDHYKNQLNKLDDVDGNMMLHSESSYNKILLNENEVREICTLLKFIFEEKIIHFQHKFDAL